MTYQLHLGQVLFPPQVRLHVWTERRKHVVSIHYSMHERVEHAEEKCLPAADIFQAEPAVRKHGRVVEHVEHRDLLVLLSQCEKYLCKEEDSLYAKISFWLSIGDFTIVTVSIRSINFDM
jgi:hypothetical protein